MTAFHLPDLGEGLQEAEIVAWHVSPGDRVVADQPLVSVETDKAVVEIPSPQSGRIKALSAGAGDIVAVGAVLAEFEDDARADAGAVVGELPSAPEKVVQAAEQPPQPHAEPITAGTAVKAAPAVRVLARSLGVDLAALKGTGPGGAITSADVEKATDRIAAAGEPLRGARRAMAQAMARAGEKVVPATVQDVANIEAWPDGADPTVRLIRAIVAGVAAEPRINAWLDGEGPSLQVHDRVDLGLAVDMPEGLFVPVIRDAGALGDEDLQGRLEYLKKAVADRSIPREELSGQTLTLSNFGTIAGRFATLVVVPPQVAILGAGRIDRQVVASGDEMVICRMLPLSLTFDHRAITGGEAARFLAAVIADLEKERMTA